MAVPTSETTGRVRPAQVEIVLDIACAWSYIGLTRFRRVLVDRVGVAGAADVRVQISPYQLDPSAGTDGEPALTVLRERFGEAAVQDAERIAELGATEDLRFDYRRAVHTNTFDAHRWIAGAQAEGLGVAMADRLFRANFSEGRNVADPVTLVELARDVGVRAEPVPAEVLTERLDRVRSQGVGQVPVFRFAGGAVLSGAPDPDALAAELDRALDHRE